MMKRDWTYLLWSIALVLLLLFCGFLVGRATAEQYRIVVEPSPYHITWTQITVDYDSTQGMFLAAAHGPDVGGRIGGIICNDGPGTAGFPVFTPLANRHVLCNFIGEYSSQADVLRLWFSAPVELRIDRRDVAGNDPTHLITDEPSYIEPGDVLLEIEEVVSASVPTGGDTWGRVKSLFR